MPGLIAQEILGVNPMTSRKSYTTGIDYVDDTSTIDWYWVQSGSPTIFSMRYGQLPSITEMEKWCKETFDDQTTWKTNFSKYYFKDEEMRTMFILRWSNDL